MYDIFYEQSAALGADAAARDRYAACCLSNMKVLFPNGLRDFNGDMPDSVKIAVMKMGAACAKDFRNSVNKWEPEIVNQLKLTFYSYPEVKLLKDTVKAEYVDCLALKVIAQFPNGVAKGDEKAFRDCVVSARKECMKLLANKYEKLRKTKVPPLPATADTVAR
ncbi:hypothetical protein [Mucilaginibacter pedocola]|nr:hypothetical protein [Mucilaginibacter pedocola]